jgi:signal transduction histidine kinase
VIAQFAIEAAAADGPERERIVLRHVCDATGADSAVLYVLSATTPGVLRPAATIGEPIAPLPLEVAALGDHDGVERCVTLRAHGDVVGAVWMTRTDGTLRDRHDPEVEAVHVLAGAFLAPRPGEAEAWRRELDELRTPLSTIAGFSELLEQPGDDGGRFAHDPAHVHAIRESAAELLVRLELLEQRSGVVRR